MGYGVGDTRRQGIAIFVIVAVAIVLIGCTGRAIDVISWHVAIGKLQAAANDGVRAASIAPALGESPQAVARQAIARDGLVNGKNQVQVHINLPPREGRYAGSHDAIEIIISKTQPMYFTSLFLRLAPHVTESTATARAVGALHWSAG